MALELSSETQAELEVQASQAGQNVDSYLRTLLLANARPKHDREAAERAMQRHLEHMKTSTSTSGRNGRPWREFIHEGHNR